MRRVGEYNRCSTVGTNQQDQSGCFEVVFTLSHGLTASKRVLKWRKREGEEGDRTEDRTDIAHSRKLTREGEMKR